MRALRTENRALRIASASAAHEMAMAVLQVIITTDASGSHQMRRQADQTRSTSRARAKPRGRATREADTSGAASRVASDTPTDRPVTGERMRAVRSEVARHDGAWLGQLLDDAAGSGAAPLSLVPDLQASSERMMARLNGVTEYLLYQRPREVGDTAQQMEDITQKATQYARRIIRALSGGDVNALGETLRKLPETSSGRGWR